MIAFLTAADLDRIFTFPALIEALREAFSRGATVVPPRHHHKMPRHGEAEATLLLMPAWDGPAEGEASFLGVKVVSIVPDNARRELATLNGTYLLMNGATGAPLAVIDGQALTLWRTAAASALAASYLAREDATRMVMVGAGALAPYLIAAHASVRPIAEVSIWNRTPEKAERLAAKLRDGLKANPLPLWEKVSAERTGEGSSSIGLRVDDPSYNTSPQGGGESPMTIRAVSDLESAVRLADIVSCATLSPQPLVKGAWLKRGAHLDLVGAYTSTTRECDDEAARRARSVVDTRAGALKEAGDILMPLAAGVISERDVVGDLFELCRGAVGGRATADEVTLFKSVGSAIEDLAAAALAFAGRA